MTCELCGMEWCGRPCMNDPRKGSAALFHADGRRKTLSERGLGLEPGELDRRREAMEQAKRDGVPYDYKPFAKEALAKAREQGRRTDWLQAMPADFLKEIGSPAARPRAKPKLVELKRVVAGTENRGTENRGTENVVPKKRGRGRPKSGKAMTATERKRRWLERQKGKRQDFKG
jgi:hypothetical protein